MNKPIIGIIGKVQPQYGEDIWHRIDEVDEIKYLIVKSGGIAITLLPTEATLNFNDNDIKDNTILSEEEKNELYRQIDLCDGFKISSLSYDGLVESFELNNKKFILGIKWHPELMLEDEFTKNLFKEFIQKCENKGI